MRLKSSKLLVFQERSTQERVLLCVHSHQHTGDRPGQCCPARGEERGESLSVFLSLGSIPIDARINRAIRHVRGCGSMRRGLFENVPPSPS